jgi:hypothetical protein
LRLDPPLSPMRLEPLGLVDFIDFHGGNTILAGGAVRFAIRAPRDGGSDQL